MTQPVLSLDARLGLDKYEIDREHSHISLEAGLCQTCLAQPCLTVCPAQVYTLVEGHIAVRYENCLECGTCQIACRGGGKGAITWRNPQGGFGILYRYG